LSSATLLLGAAGAVGVLHSALPDHWVPIAVVARANRWSLRQTARTSLWAGIGHVLGSLALGALVIALGAGVKSVVAVQGRVVGLILAASGLGFLGWALLARRRGHPPRRPHEGPGPEPDPALARCGDGAAAAAPRLERRGWAASLAVPFGVAASPDLTILPVFLAASAVGVTVAIAAVLVFSCVTLLTFVALSVAATLGGYRVDWPWLEENAEVVSAVVLLALGVVVYAGA
jgi:nickel/cobalt exporter